MKKRGSFFLSYAGRVYRIWLRQKARHPEGAVKIALKGPSNSANKSAFSARDQPCPTQGTMSKECGYALPKWEALFV